MITLTVIGAFWRGSPDFHIMESFSGTLDFDPEKETFKGKLQDHFGVSRLEGKFVRGVAPVSLQWDKIYNGKIRGAKGRFSYFMYCLGADVPLITTGGTWLGVYALPRDGVDMGDPLSRGAAHGQAYCIVMPYMGDPPGNTD